MRRVSTQIYSTISEPTDPQSYRTFQSINYASFSEDQSKLVIIAERMSSKKDLDSNTLYPQENWMYKLKPLEFFGVVLVLEEALNSLKIVSCSLQNAVKYTAVPDHLFSWDIDHFLTRASLPSSKYLFRFAQDNYHNLDVIKLKVDIDAIIDILETLMCGIFNDTNLENVERKLRGVYQLLRLQGTLLEEKQANEDVLKTLDNKLVNYEKVQQKEFEEWLKWIKTFRDEFYDQELIQYPIEVRYAHNHENARNAQLAIKLENEDKVYVSEIDDFKIKYGREEEVSVTIKDAYEAHMNKIKAQIEEKMDQYETEYDRLDLQKSRILGQLDEAIAILKKHKEMCEYFQSEIDKHIVEEEAKEAERAWRALIEADAQNDDEEKSKQKDKQKKTKGKKGKGKK